MKEGPWTKIGVLLAGVGVIIAYLTLVDTEKSLPPSKYPDPVVKQPERRYEWISGGYRGTCYNLTYGVGANLRLVIRAEDSGRVTGSVTISGNLTGSGPLEGYTDGDEISFTSRDPTTGLAIAWEGIIDGTYISGDYTTSLPAHIKAQNPYARDEEGTWKAAK